MISFESVFRKSLPENTTPCAPVPRTESYKICSDTRPVPSSLISPSSFRLSGNWSIMLGRNVSLFRFYLTLQLSGRSGVKGFFPSNVFFNAKRVQHFSNPPAVVSDFLRAILPCSPIGVTIRRRDLNSCPLEGKGDGMPFRLPGRG